MAFTGNWATDAFKQGLFAGAFDFSANTAQVFKLALYSGDAELNASTDAYTTAGEISGAGYTAGGVAVTPAVGSTAFVSFSDAVWSGALSARGGLLYVANGLTNTAICVLDFGAQKTSTTQFVVRFPNPSQDAALLRIA